MKKLLVVLMVLSMATIANAGLQIAVDGQVPTGPVELRPSDFVVLSLVSDGLTMDPVGGLYHSEGIVLSVTGPGLIDITNASAPGAAGGGIPVEDFIIDNGDGSFFIDLSWPGNPIPMVPAGVAVNGLLFHCELEGDVTIVVMGDATGLQQASLAITQIPEPMTLGLLGLGGLFLRRRSK